MAFVGSLLVSRKGGDAGGVGGLDDGIEVESRGALAVGVVAEVGEVESDASRLPLDAGDEFADLNLILDGVDVDDIVGTGVTGTKAWVEFQFNTEAVGRDFPLFSSVAWQKLHTANKACGEQQTGIVDNHRAVLVGEMLFVEVGELVVFDMAVTVGFFGEAALDGGAEERGGVLHGLE